MDEECNSEMAPGISSLTCQSDSKMIKEKRKRAHSGEKQDLARQRVKMRDLDSVVQSADFAKEKGHNVQCVERVGSEEGKMGRNSFQEEVNLAARLLDLSTEAHGARCSSIDRSSGCVDNPRKGSLSQKQERGKHSNFANSRGINVDLNADVTSSINMEAVHSHKGHEHRNMKSKDVSESGSRTGPIEEKDPMRIWKEMKQNGFLSSSHGGIPMPRQRGRKSKNDILKKKMEIAKREQVNKFTKIAAPSGLLNELNPGIINHVRNRKQVHSIIEALVKSEMNENNNVGSKQVAHRMNVCTEVGKRDLVYTSDVDKHELTFPHEEGTLHSFSGSRETRKYPLAMNDSSRILEGKVCDRDACTVEKPSNKSCVSQSTHVTDDALDLKLSSTKASMSSSSLSNEESSNITIVSSLSVKAATVASQWLELLHQDIKGRLSALRRSRRRVRAVITTELPFLISKEFANNQENDSYAMETSVGLPTSKAADLHRAKWTALFDHMDEALLEEEKQLESWLNQVKEKQLLCDQGLQHVNWNMSYAMQQLGTSENDSRVSVLNCSEKDLAVNAAAASIYSTCSFLLSEN